MIKNTRIKESVFCYWCSIYEEEMMKIKDFKDENLIINKVTISELDKKRYQKRVFLNIENNKTSILESGTEINFIEITDYIQDNQNEKNKYEKLYNYFEKQNEDVLLVGIKMNRIEEMHKKTQ